MTLLSSRRVAIPIGIAILLACGEVPTFADGIASISAVELPSLVVGAGDVLRDSTGAKAPLKVEAFDINGKVIAGVPVTYVVTPVDTGIHIDANGYLTASDSVRVVHIVARVGDRLQTTQAQLNVVPIPDQILGSGTTDPLVGFPAKGPLAVTITGARRGSRAPTQGVVVRYRVLSVNGNGAVDPARVFLADDQNFPLRDTPTLAVDTTDASGIAKRFVVVADTAGVSSVQVEASARSLRGETLSGNPVVFNIPLKKSP